MEIALDAIAAHPSTAPFVSRKILQLLVTDEPTQAMVDTLVAEWNDGGNPHGSGDLREVTRAALTLSEFQDMAASGYKVKSPFEHFMSAIRALRGSTDGMTAILGSLFGGEPGYMIQSKHLLFYNLIPTGWPEVGDEWIDTNTILVRQNYGMHLALSSNPAFGTDLIALLNDSGVSTAPGNAAGIVDFLSEVLYGGQLPPGDRQRALDFLLTDDDGLPDPNYTETRIRQTAGIMLGFAQFKMQ
jgi:hypothetical protein